MKLSKKAKKRLLILGMLISPFVVLFIAYLFNIGEPAEYKEIRVSLEESDSGVENKVPVLKLNVPSSFLTTTTLTSLEKKEIPPPNPAMYSLHHIDWELGPKYHYWGLHRLYGPERIADEENLTDQIWYEIQWLFQFFYREEPSGYHPDLIQAHLDQINDYFLDSHFDAKTLAQPYSFKKPTEGSFTLLYLSVYREVHRGNIDKAKELHQVFTQYITESLSSGNELSAANWNYRQEYILLLYFNMSWMLLEKGCFSDEESERLKQHFIDLYSQDTYQHSEKYSELRKAYIIQKVEQLCERLDQKTNSVKVTSSFNFFLEDSFGGVLNTAWYSTVNPLIKKQLREHALLLIENDMENLQRSRSGFDRYESFLMLNNQLDHIENELFANGLGLLPEDILNDFPEYKINYGMKSFALDMVCLVEVCDIYHQTGEYPLGEYIPSFTEDDFSKQNKFYLLRLDPIDDSFEYTSFVEGDRKKNLQKIAPRLYIISGITGNGFLDNRYSALYEMQLFQFKAYSPEDYERIRQYQRVPVTSYQWTFRFWEESEETLNRLLLEEDSPP